MKVIISKINRLLIWPKFTSRICSKTSCVNTTEGTSNKGSGILTCPKKAEVMSNPSSNRDRLGQWGAGDKESRSLIRGIDRMLYPSLNKGLAFTIEERQQLGIHGLLPPVVKTVEEQLEHCLYHLSRYDDKLNKYIYLMGLLNRHEKLFFRLMSENVTELLPLVYTPTVGLACQMFSKIYTQARGLYITIYDKGHIYEVLKNWPETDVRAIVVTDGERILGLGDLGVNGMGIPIGKLCLYTALGGIKPHYCLPITLDVGTNTDSILNDPTYIGLRQKRVTGEKYDEFLDEFMKAVVKRYGRNCLIQFEDFGNNNAFRLLEKFKNKYCTFNDDIQGTAGVAVAGILASLRVTKKRVSENVILFQGAGEANLGIAELCVMAMKAEGLCEKDAREKIWLVDSRGLIVKDRPAGGITGHKTLYAHAHAPIASLAEVVKTLKPNILIGAAAIGGAFTKEILQEMARNNDIPVIFALSNPTSKAECTAEEAYTHTNGKALFASGSPFDPVTINGKTYHPGQGNNSYIFPGVALATICAGLRVIENDVFLVAAEELASIVSKQDLDKGSLYPPLSNILDVSLKIAVKVLTQAYDKGTASVFPEPTDKETYIRNEMYSTELESALAETYDIPQKK